MTRTTAAAVLALILAISGFSRLCAADTQDGWRVTIGEYRSTPNMALCLAGKKRPFRRPEWRIIENPTSLEACDEVLDVNPDDREIAVWIDERAVTYNAAIGGWYCGLPSNRTRAYPCRSAFFITSTRESPSYLFLSADLVKEAIRSVDFDSWLTKAMAAEAQTEAEQRALVEQRQREAYLARYRSAYEGTSSKPSLQAFIDEFGDDDPDALVVAAKKRVADLQAEREAAEAADQAKLASEAAERARTKPKCDYVQVTGVAVAGFPGLIDQVLKSPDIEDTLARNPIICSGMSCTGVAYVNGKVGRVLNWNSTHLGVMLPVDFEIGRRDIMLLVRRRDTVCAAR